MNYTINKDLAEFIGILLGDGYLSGHKNNYEIKISLDKIKEKDYSLYLQKLFYQLFHLKILSYERTSDGTLDLRISNKNLMIYLTEFIGLHKSPKMDRAEIPPLLFKPQFYTSLLRGYFDTDGCIVDTDNNGIRYPRIEMKICRSPMQL